MNEPMLMLVAIASATALRAALPAPVDGRIRKLVNQMQLTRCKERGDDRLVPPGFEEAEMRESVRKKYLQKELVATEIPARTYSTTKFGSQSLSGGGSLYAVGFQLSLQVRSVQRGLC